MQLMPRHGAAVRARQPLRTLRATWRPAVRHLKSLLGRYDMRSALAAYNAGEAAVRRFQGRAPVSRDPGLRRPRAEPTGALPPAGPATPGRGLEPGPTGTRGSRRPKMGLAPTRWLPGAGGLCTTPGQAMALDFAYASTAPLYVVLTRARTPHGIPLQAGHPDRRHHRGDPRRRRRKPAFATSSRRRGCTSWRSSRGACSGCLGSSSSDGAFPCASSWCSTRSWPRCSRPGCRSCSRWTFCVAGSPTRCSRGCSTTCTSGCGAGASLSEAFEAHGALFPGIYTASLLAGEKSGGLEQVLRRYVTYVKTVVDREAQDAVGPDLSGRARAALLRRRGDHRAAVVPEFGAFYENFGKELPLATRVIVAISEVARTGGSSSSARSRRR